MTRASSGPRAIVFPFDLSLPRPTRQPQDEENVLRGEVPRQEHLQAEILNEP